jgi:uncharacterized protein
LYLDSSAMLSVYLAEGDRRSRVVAMIDEAQTSYCSPLAFIEVRSGLARARYRDNPPRLTAPGYTRALTLFQDDWPTYTHLELSDEIVHSAGDLAEIHRLRAYDAVHLATTLFLQGRTADSLLLATWDRDLATAAAAEGLSLAHEVTT